MLLLQYGKNRRIYIDGSVIKTYIVLSTHSKKSRRILFADYAVRHRLQAVKERKKICGNVSCRKSTCTQCRSIHAVVDVFVRSVDTNHKTCQETMKSA